MAEPTQLKSKTGLYEAVMRSRSNPTYRSDAEAAQGTARKLESLASEYKMTVAALIEQAHTTNKSQPHHIEALQLERQLAYFQSRSE